VTEQTTSTPLNLFRLTKAAAVLQLMAAHLEVAAAPIDWKIDDRDGLWPEVRHGSEDAESAAGTLAAALGAKVNVADVGGMPLYTVYGDWAGIRVSLQAFGPERADEVSA
jgi:hypothetical protein